MIYFNEFVRLTEEKKFFYDYFTDNDVCGMFTAGHIISIVLFLVLAGVMLYLSRKVSREGVKRIHIPIAIIVTVMEMLKIGIRIYKNQSYDSWLPLYYCSLFLFAVWMSLSHRRVIARMGYAFIAMGGVTASLFFVLYPSTSLAIFPIWHPASIHSFVYHLVMFYTGLLVLIRGVYVPKKSDAAGYFVFILLASVPSVILNAKLGTNCMFLNHAFKLPLLEPIIQYSKPIYMAVVFLAQGVLMFWGNYFFYNIPNIIKEIKIKIRKEGEAN